ncbi:hypothetical protein ISF_09989 [Cordyceps fumosorosea ARSEF 2679]|uniref:F-box domain-containing protein n=1 Tax=Cordyceps fumosorosea (strain ARSEF 2679) TaxID=1081104 RepID=A0A166WXH8_CORFA|nr:hypothetical protein ISF_09989 [Cordyceps fumosorosea ARSEF 2679]OAA35199.1 hypothetical protein ISF_09989 [Cordyceps fumosorosea ARSEF 2679]
MVPTTADILAGFLDLPGELRNYIYEFILLQKEPLNPFVYYTPQANLTTGLFRANRTIYRETTLFLYSRNVFDVTNAGPGQVSSFIGRIGNINAGYIRHIITTFPSFLDLNPGDVTFEDDSSKTLKMIQAACTGLSTLETSLDSTNSMELRLDNLDHHKLATEALELVNTHFRAIPSIQEIILNVFEDGPSDYLRSIMTSYGWTIKTTEYEEEEEDDRGYYDFDYDDYHYDYSSGDEYDIDNDSDFWRRAAD